MGVGGTEHGGGRIHAARASICCPDAVKTAGRQPDCDPHVGAGDWRDFGGLQPDPGRAADTPAVQGTALILTGLANFCSHAFSGIHLILGIVVLCRLIKTCRMARG